MIDCPHLASSLGSELSSEAQAHLAGCPACQQARSAFDRLGQAEPSPSLDSVEKAVAAELTKHPRVWPWWVEALGVVAVNALFAGAMLASMRWNTVQHDSPGLRFGVSGDLVLLVVAGTLSAFAPRGRTLRWATVVLAAVVAISTLLAASGNDPGTGFWRGAHCGLIEVGASLVPLAVALWLSTRMAADATRTVAWSLSAGSAALLALHLHCPNGTLAHLVSFHLIPWTLLALLAWAARRALPTKSYAP